MSWNLSTRGKGSVGTGFPRKSQSGVQPSLKLKSKSLSAGIFSFTEASGVSLSPLLFALYVVDMGQSLQMSKEGIKVGTVVVSCLFFADDLLLVSRDENGLLRLLSLVKYHADLIHMEINTGKDKSEIISSVGDEGDLWDVLDDAGMSVLSLTQVIN